MSGAGLLPPPPKPDPSLPTVCQCSAGCLSCSQHGAGDKSSRECRRVSDSIPALHFCPATHSSEQCQKAALAAAVTESVRKTYRRSHAPTNKVMTLTGEAEMRIYGNFYLFLSIFISELNSRSVQFEPCATCGHMPSPYTFNCPPPTGMLIPSQ